MEKILELQTTFEFQLGGLATSTMSNPRSTRDNGESYEFTGMTGLVARTAKQKENGTAAEECHWKKRSGSSMSRPESVEDSGEKGNRDVTFIATRAHCCCLAREGETSAGCDPITSDRDLEDLLIPVGRAATQRWPRLFCLIWHDYHLSDYNIIS
jgi:hypothetical protein